MSPTALLSLLFCGLTTMHSNGTRLPNIVIRHDRADSLYLQLGARFPFVGKVGRRMGDGTLIGDRWVLTAAHVANGLMRRGGEPVVFFGDVEYRVVEAYIHPSWTDFSPLDIALLRLKDPVQGIRPAKLFLGNDERGRTATLVGHGRTGTGNSAERRDDDRRRGATNRIESATADQIVFRFDEPPGGTDLEGIPGAGDSGGPALLFRNEVAYVAGVSSAGQPGPAGPGSYGALDYFTRVSRFAAWIRRVMEGKVRPTNFGQPPARADASVLPDSPAGQRLVALTRLLFSGDTSSVSRFISENVSQTTIAERSVADLRRMFLNLIAEYRGGSVTGVLLNEPSHVDALVKTPVGDRILGIMVERTGEKRILRVLHGRP